MKSRWIRTAGICVLMLCIAHSLACAQTPADAGIAKQADAIVDNYRKIIVLMDGAATLDPGVQERASTAGKILFQQNQERLSALEDQLAAPIAKADMALAEEFLTRLESNPEYRDADKLAFLDTLENLAAAVGTSNDRLATRLRQDQGALAQVQTLYQKEIREILGNLQARGMVVHREAWEHYVASLRRKYTREQI